jgi:hypothetical protein
MLIGRSSRFWITIIAGTFASTAAAAEDYPGSDAVVRIAVAFKASDAAVQMTSPAASGTMLFRIGNKRVPPKPRPQENCALKKIG